MMEILSILGALVGLGYLWLGVIGVCNAIGLISPLVKLVVFGLIISFFVVLWHKYEENLRVSQDKTGGFGIDTQMRRRKLDLTRKDNSFTRSIGTKIKRQRQGIFGRRRK